MKRAFYIFLASTLGCLVFWIFHALIEILYIQFFISDFKRYSIGLSWSALIVLHDITLTIALLIGALIGTRLGIRWWRIIYIEKRYPWKNIR